MSRMRHPKTKAEIDVQECAVPHHERSGWELVTDEEQHEVEAQQPAEPSHEQDEE